MPAKQNDIDERIAKTLVGNALCLKALMGCLFIISLAEASSQTLFYQGKTITLVSDIAAGEVQRYSDQSVASVLAQVNSG